MAVFEELSKPAPYFPLSDRVPWRSIAAPGVVLHKDAGHTLQRCWQVRGPDVMGLAEEVQASLMFQANNALKRLGGKWMFQSEAQRLRVETLPPLPEDVPPLVRLLDAAYRQLLLKDPGLRETTYYHTLCWTPPFPSTQRWGRFFVRGPGEPTRARTPQEVSVLDFIQQADSYMGLLRGMLAQCTPLTTQELLTYLHTTVNDRWYPRAVPGSLVDIDMLLCDTALSPAGWYPQLGRWHLRTCSLKAYPAESLVGMVKDLEHLPLDFRWCTRWLGMEKHLQEGILQQAQRAWVHTEKTLTDRVTENATHESTRVINRAATNAADEVDMARQEIGADIYALGEFTSTVTVWDEDPTVAEDKRQLVMQTFAARGIGTVQEKQHQTAAWLSTHPGNRRDNVNTSHQSTFTLAHLCPGLTAAWRGPLQDAYLCGGPWFYTRTEGNTLFRVVNHLRDLGHFLILGSTGSGKSTLGNWLRLLWLQYNHTQAKLFDLDRHGRLLTLLLRGSWYDLGHPLLRLQPLRHVDDPDRFTVILEWIVALCEEAGVVDTLLAQRYLASGLRELAKRPLDQRTFSGLLAVFAEPPPGQKSAFNRNRTKVDGQGVAHLDTTMNDLDRVQMHVRWVLQRFAFGGEGEYAGLFDGTSEDFDDNPVQTFELRDLLSRPRLLGPILRYVFPAIERQMSTDRPMFLLFDDAAVPWKVPQIRDKSDEWLQTSRKKAVSLGFSTHSLSQVFNSPLGLLLEESIPLRFYLANTEATIPDIRAIYHQIGLADTAIEAIAAAQPQRDVYYHMREMGQRPFHLDLPPVVLDCLARNAAEDHRLIDELLAKEGREGFSAAWLRHHGYEEECLTYYGH